MRTIYVLTPVSEEAKNWVEENVNYEDYQIVGSGIAVEHRHISPIVSAMKEAGLKYSEDFLVR